MGKNKRGPKPPRKRILTKSSGISKSHPPSKPKATRKHTQAYHTQATIPFQPSEHILLIGEGDLSFAAALVTHHHCTNLVATVYESAAELKEKYPHVEENVKVVEEGGGKVVYGIDAGKMKIWDEKGKEGKGPGGMDRIIFNFPHVGGKSKDVNRQVRYNQELLVYFFKRAMPSLSPRHGSSIIVTLFESEPYTLWNIRDLARHSGLEVLQSFKFQADAYPGYKHARTLGVVKGRDGHAGAGWKGEERKSRTFVFVGKGEGVVMGQGKNNVESSDDEDDMEEEGFGDGEEMDEVEDDGD